MIPLRITFPYETDENMPMWAIWDYSMDFFYLLDMILVKPRVVYLEDGFWVRNPKIIRKKYIHNIKFKVDIYCKNYWLKKKFSFLQRRVFTLKILRGWKSKSMQEGSPVKQRQRARWTHNALYRNFVKAGVFSGSIRDDRVQHRVYTMKCLRDTENNIKT